MKCFSRLSMRTELDAVVHDLCVDLNDFGADLAVLFVSHHYEPDFHKLVHGIYHGINCRNLIGCTGESIIGPTAEIESQPAAVLWLAKLPQVRVFPFVLDQDDLLGLAEAEPHVWYDRLGVTPEDAPSFVVLSDPHSFDAQSCLAKMDNIFGGATIVGGQASGAESAGQNRLFVGDQALRQGMVGVSLSGNVSITAVVSQGCRPVGEPFVITRAHDNLIQELGGKPALTILQEVYKQASDDEQRLMRQGLQVGRLMDEHHPDAGEFLVRNMMGVSPDRAIAIGDYVRPGQTVRFHVRDAQSANDEMDRLLRENHAADAEAAAGALLFSCNGRGRRFFQTPNHDIGLLNSIIEDCPTAGFFAQGEIGPVGGRTFVHGFTSSLILFREL